MLRLEAGAAQFAEEELGVVVHVLHDENPKNVIHESPPLAAGCRSGSGKRPDDPPSVPLFHGNEK